MERRERVIETEDRESGWSRTESESELSTHQLFRVCVSRLRGAACAHLLMLSSSIIDQNPYRQFKQSHSTTALL